MNRVALDSNVLIYAELEPETAKGHRAAQLILRAAANGVIPIQVLGEFLRVIQRRVPDALSAAVRQVALYKATFLTPPTTDAVIELAADYAVAHQLQLWDGVICAAARLAGAKTLLTEDLQDGRVLDGLVLVNPFEPANAAKVDELLRD